VVTIFLVAHMLMFCYSSLFTSRFFVPAFSCFVRIFLYIGFYLLVFYISVVVCLRMISVSLFVLFYMLCSLRYVIVAVYVMFFFFLVHVVCFVFSVCFIVCCACIFHCSLLAFVVLSCRSFISLFLLMIWTILLWYLGYCLRMFQVWSVLSSLSC